MELKNSPSFSIKNEKFNIIILAAGLGSRLKPETEFIPKALLKIGNKRAIDYIIDKYKFIAQNIVISVAYGADLIENYIKGKYINNNFLFSHENIESLLGPGQTLIYALDYVNIRNPTLVTFCDYIINDFIHVDNDGLGICRTNSDSILDDYATVAVLDEGVIVDIKKNEKLNPDFGFCGLGIFHNTLLLKKIAYDSMLKNSMDYTFDIICKYIHEVKTFAEPIYELFDFGTPKTLEKLRKYANGNNKPHNFII